VAKDDQDILKIRDEDTIEEDSHPAKAFIQTPPAVSSARTERVPSPDNPLNRQASYEEQFAGRIARLNRLQQGLHGAMHLQGRLCLGIGAGDVRLGHADRDHRSAGDRRRLAIVME